jgi:hypothetical protein
MVWEDWPTGRDEAPVVIGITGDSNLIVALQDELLDKFSDDVVPQKN